MRKRINIGTDIATIGFWDPSCERPDLSAAKYAAYQAGLEAEANAGRLFFILTGADGSYPADVYTNQVPAPNILTLYESADRRFLIRCTSGRMVAGGIEDFVNPKKITISLKDQFALKPGSYAIQIYERVEEKMISRLRDELGEPDYEYYARRAERLPWGCLLAVTIVFSVIVLLTQFWIIALVVFCAGVAYTAFRYRTQTVDVRYESIAERVDSFDKDIPPFVYVIQPIGDNSNVTGGWHTLA